MIYKKRELIFRGDVMGKKKVAFFSTSWAAELLYQYSIGLKEGFSDEDVDLYLFFCHAAPGNTDGYQQGELNIFKLPDLNDFDAALIFANGIDYPEILEMLTRKCDDAGIPLIFTGKDDLIHYFVGCDNYVGAKQLAQHLLEKHNVRSVWFMAGSQENMDSNYRIKAVDDAMKEYGLKLSEDNIRYTNWVPYVATDYINARLKKGDKLPDAIVCANDTLAMVVCAELKEKGINVPDDVIVTGADNEPNSQIYDPSISSVNQSFIQVGKKCAEIIKKVLAGEKCDRKHSVDSEFWASESCGCCEVRDFNSIRREAGRRKFIDQIENSNFELRLGRIERLVLHGKMYQDLSKSLKTEYARFSGYEGESFHILMDESYSKSIDNPGLSLRTDGYPDKMDVIFSKDGGNISSFDDFNTKDLVPFAKSDYISGNRLFIFMPLHDEENVFGYVVFCDDYDKIKEAIQLRKYTERMNLLLGKYHSDLRIATLNMRLLRMSQTDSLTHVKNRVCYEAKENELQQKISSGINISFAIAVFDINNLKLVNDTYGHEMGDYYIINSCQLICKCFKNSPVYRIGGDEFVVILEETDYDNREENISLFKEKIEMILKEAEVPWERVSIACGLAAFDPETDHNVTDIFKRADNLMYECKMDMKSKMKLK